LKRVTFVRPECWSNRRAFLGRPIEPRHGTHTFSPVESHQQNSPLIFRSHTHEHEHACIYTHDSIIM